MKYLLLFIGLSVLPDYKYIQDNAAIMVVTNYANAKTAIESTGMEIGWVSCSKKILIARWKEKPTFKSVMVSINTLSQNVFITSIEPNRVIRIEND